MKYSYLCIVRRKIESDALDSPNLFSGLTKFTACPARKKRKSDEWQRVHQPQTTNLGIIITTITMEVKAVEKKLKFSKSPLHSGNSTQNTEPLPKVDCTPTFPPRLKAMLRQMLSPRPVPGTNSSTFTKRSKRWSSQQSSGMPLPVSLTHIRNSLSCCSKPKVMDPSEVNLTALSTYWFRISLTRSLSVNN